MNTETGTVYLFTHLCTSDQSSLSTGECSFFGSQVGDLDESMTGAVRVSEHELEQFDNNNYFSDHDSDDESDLDATCDAPCGPSDGSKEAPSAPQNIGNAPHSGSSNPTLEASGSRLLEGGEPNVAFGGASGALRESFVIEAGHLKTEHADNVTEIMSGGRTQIDVDNLISLGEGSSFFVANHSDMRDKPSFHGAGATQPASQLERSGGAYSRLRDPTWNWTEDTDAGTRRDSDGLSVGDGTRGDFQFVVPVVPPLRDHEFSVPAAAPNRDSGNGSATSRSDGDDAEEPIEVSVDHASHKLKSRFAGTCVLAIYCNHTCWF